MSPPCDVPPLPIYEVHPADGDIAAAAPYALRRLDERTLLIECPRAFGDRHAWVRRWDLEHARRTTNAGV